MNASQILNIIEASAKRLAPQFSTSVELPSNQVPGETVTFNHTPEIYRTANGRIGISLAANVVGQTRKQAEDRLREFNNAVRAEVGAEIGGRAVGNVKRGKYSAWTTGYHNLGRNVVTDVHRAIGFKLTEEETNSLALGRGLPV